MGVQGKGGKRVSTGAGRIGKMQSCGIGESRSGRNACVRIKIVQRAARLNAEKWQKAAKEPEKGEGVHRAKGGRDVLEAAERAKKAAPRFYTRGRPL